MQTKCEFPMWYIYTCTNGQFENAMENRKLAK